jgi:hypothetical protein
MQHAESMTKVKEACDELVSALTSTEDESPLYLCVWGDGYAESGRPIIEVHAVDFFSVDRGYSEKDREAISNLAFGESITVSGVADIQSVVRIL